MYVIVLVHRAVCESVKKTAQNAHYKFLPNILKFVEDIHKRMNHNI